MQSIDTDDGFFSEIAQDQKTINEQIKQGKIELLIASLILGGCAYFFELKYVVALGFFLLVGEAVRIFSAQFEAVVRIRRCAVLLRIIQKRGYPE